MGREKDYQNNNPVKFFQSFMFFKRSKLKRQTHRSGFFHVIHMPDFTGTFVTDHTGSDRCPWIANFQKELAIRRLGDSPENLVADTGSMFADMPEHNIELFLCIVLFKLLLQP
jgi:hypothetical protein